MSRGLLAVEYMSYIGDKGTVDEDDEGYARGRSGDTGGEIKCALPLLLLLLL